MNYEALLKKFNEQKEALHQDKTSINYCAHRYLAYGLDCIEYFAHNYQLVLDCTFESLQTIDLFIHQVYLTYCEEAFDLNPLSDMISGYVSLVLDELFQGNWVYDENQEAYEIHTNHLYLHDEVMACMMQDQSIKEKIKSLENF